MDKSVVILGFGKKSYKNAIFVGAAVAENRKADAKKYPLFYLLIGNFMIYYYCISNFGLHKKNNFVGLVENKQKRKE